MHQAVNKILVVAKPDDPQARAIKVAMLDFLAAQGVEAEACEHLSDVCGRDRLADRHFDLVVVLGGDGTFIGVARRLVSLGAPLMGVNLGRVGFLAQLHRDHWRLWLEDVLRDGIEVASRLALTYDVLRDGNSVYSGLVINDLVVSRGELARLIRLGIAYDGLEVSRLRADGVIVSTPTGSSAYGVSAGGPLMHLALDAYCVTPVCPFLNSFKPMVLPGTGEVRIRVEEAGGEVNLTEDGQSVVGLEHGDEVCIRRSDHDLRVVDLGPGAYFEKLKKHGFLTER